MRLRSKRRGSLGPHREYDIEVRRSAIHGYGVFALQAFKPGDFIGIMSGILHEEGSESCPYTCTIKDTKSGYTYDLEPAWPFCHLNHRKRANATAKSPIVLATRYIKIDHEITIHYGSRWSNVK